MINELIKISNLQKIYYSGSNQLKILNEINFNVLKGEIISILGPSGSGKSTFLNILGLLDYEFNGEYFLLSKNTKKLRNNSKNLIRNKSLGFVHQFFHLIPELSVIENVSLPNLINGNSFMTSSNNAKNILCNFGLEDRLNHKPINLSGGEKQRVAIARALINNPQIVLADEMTGNLDKKTSDRVFDFFLEKIIENKQTLIYVTHNREYAKRASKIYEIINQKLNRIL